MTIWVDAQLSPVIAGWLTEHMSIESCHVGSLGLLAASDSEIFAAARAAGAVILTKDRDLLIWFNATSPSIHHLDHLRQYV